MHQKPIHTAGKGKPPKSAPLFIQSAGGPNIKAILYQLFYFNATIK